MVTAQMLTLLAALATSPSNFHGCSGSEPPASAVDAEVSGIGAVPPSPPAREPTPDELELLDRLLRSPRWEAERVGFSGNRSPIAHAARELTSRDTGLLVWMARHPSVVVRAYAGEELARRPDGLEALRPLLRDAAPLATMRYHANETWPLGYFLLNALEPGLDEPVGLVTVLEEVAAEEGGTAWQQLLARDEARAVRILEAWSRSDDPSLWLQAVEGLAQLGDEGALRLGGDFLRHEAADWRMRAARALALFGDARAIAALEGHPHDSPGARLANTCIAEAGRRTHEPWVLPRVLERCPGAATLRFTPHVMRFTPTHALVFDEEWWESVFIVAISRDTPAHRQVLEQMVSLSDANAPACWSPTAVEAANRLAFWGATEAADTIHRVRERSLERGCKDDWFEPALAHLGGLERREASGPH